MISRGYVSAALAALACSVSSLAQLKAPSPSHALRAGQSAARSTQTDLAAQQPRILWIRNDKTGQVITPGAHGNRAAAEDPIFVYNNYDNPTGLAGINLNWNYAEAYTDNDFVPPAEGDPLRFGLLNISTDPTDPSDDFLLVNGEKLCLMFEPYHAATWPVNDLNERQNIAEYTSVVASYSEQFEIRVCRIYFFSLADVNAPFDAVENPYALELQLSFAFVSFAFQTVESPFSFDLTGFDPPLQIKGDGLILTHWLKFSEPPVCVGDLNEDGLVEDADFVMFLAQYNVLDCSDETMPEFCSADLNFDGFVDDADFVIFLSGYNNLLCPAPYVIRQAYAPLAGGRFRYDNEENLPWSEPAAPAIPLASGGWPFPSTLVTVPNLGSGSYPDPFDLGCSYFGCQPSFSIFFTTLTGFQNVNELNMEAEDLKPEYERFLNEVAGNPNTFGEYAIIDVESYFEAGGFPGAHWLPSSTPKRFSIFPPEPAAK